MIIASYYCPFDGRNGQIVFRLCSDGKTIVLECDECQAVWLNPWDLSAESFISLQPPEYIIPGTSCSTRSPISRWATREEVEVFGFAHYIIDETAS